MVTLQEMWWKVVEAVGEFMLEHGYSDLDEVRHDLSCHPRGAPPNFDRDERVGKLWDVLLEVYQPMGWDNPVDVLDKIHEEFSRMPDLKRMRRPSKLP